MVSGPRLFYFGKIKGIRLVVGVGKSLDFDL